MPRLQGLIFDLDGTLLDSAPDMRRALNLTLKALGRRELTLAEVKEFVGDGMLPMLGRAFAATGIPLLDSQSYGQFQRFIGFYRALAADPVQIYPQAVQVIERYRQRGIKIGLCTNKQEAATIKLLEELSIQHLFDFIAGGDTFPVHKPHPDHVRGVIKSLQVPTDSCVMIGDGTNDVMAAQGAGIPCLVVTHGYGNDYGRLGGDGLIGGFEELQAALKKLGFE